MRGPGPSGGDEPDEGSAKTSRDTDVSPKRDITSIALQLLAAFGTGIGVLGFVVFFGAAILWIRYDRAGLPADEALAVVPKPVLLTTGAEFLAPALGVALVSVLVLLVIDVVLRSRRSLRTVKARKEKDEQARNGTKDRRDMLDTANGRAGDARSKRAALV